MIRWAMPLVLAAVLLAPAPAHAGTIVFDFEDGLQGWELHGSAQRVQTQLLGGEWAIFGDRFSGSVSIEIEVDLTDVVSISMERFLVDGDENGSGAIVFSGRPDGSSVISFNLFEVVQPGNPNLLAVDVVSHTGVGLVQIRWDDFPFVDAGLASVAFIDNITFHTIPESSVLGMLVMGGVAAVARRRARCVRHA